jgi:hypothetical protein
MLLSFNLGLSPSADPVVLRKFAFVALLEGLLCRCNTVSSRTTTQHAPTVNEKQSAPKILSRQQKKKLGASGTQHDAASGSLLLAYSIDSPASPLRGVSFFSRIPRLPEDRDR